jgi:hypothetical protein
MDKFSHQVKPHRPGKLISHCGGEVKIIACIEDPKTIEKILTHLDTKSDIPANHLPKSRAPPQELLFINE